MSEHFYFCPFDYWPSGEGSCSLAPSIHFLTFWHLSICHITPLKLLFVNITLDFPLPRLYPLKLSSVFIQTLLFWLPWHRAILILLQSLLTIPSLSHCHFVLLFKYGYAPSFFVPSTSVCFLFCSSICCICFHDSVFIFTQVTPTYLFINPTIFYHAPNPCLCLVPRNIYLSFSFGF